MSIEDHLTTTIRSEGPVTVVTATGEVDVYTAPALRDALLTASPTGAGLLLLDMTGITFLDSSGLGVLVGGLKRAKTAGGRLDLAGPGPHITAILTRTGLRRLFTIHPDPATGVSALHTGAGCPTCGSDDYDVPVTGTGPDYGGLKTCQECGEQWT